MRRFRPGDEVFGESVRGHQWHNGGAYAEYASVPEAALALKPANLTFAQAAAVPTSAFIALQGLREEGQVQPGQKVLINVQLAKAYGAHATGVDSTTRPDMLRSLGADRVIDRTYPLSEVPEALRYLEEGQAQGRVVITV